jgi:hypothetical protein
MAERLSIEAPRFSEGRLHGGYRTSYVLASSTSAAGGSHEKASRCDQPRWSARMVASMLAVAQSTGPVPKACFPSARCGCRSVRSDDPAGPATSHDALLGGSAKNFPLAAFHPNELCGALARTEWTVPNCRNISVDTVVTSILGNKLKAVDAAAKAPDQARFNAANRELRDAHPSN